MPQDEPDSQPFGAIGEFLSDYDDAHAAAEGLFDGFRHIRPRMDQSESKGNPHYYQAFYVLGYVLKAVLVVGLGRAAMGVA